MNSPANGTTLHDGRPRFSEEQWFSPMQIARKLGYTTDKPVRKAIMRGELRAIKAPCGRRLIVAESDLLGWLDHLAYEPPPISSKAPPVEPTARISGGRHRRRVPILSYDASRNGGR